MSVDEDERQPREQPQHSPPLLTEEEEAAILAEYGVRGLDDDVLDMPAASQFRSDYGDANVFLTGDVGDLSAGPDTGQDVSPSAIPDFELCNYPIDSLLLKHTGMLGHRVPVGLTSHVTNVLEELDNPSSTSPSGGYAYVLGDDEADRAAEGKRMELRDALRKGKEEERCAFMISQGRFLDDAKAQVVTEADYADTGVVIQESDDLLRRADELLNRPHTLGAHFDPMSLEEVRVMREMESVFTRDATDDALEKTELLDEDENAEVLKRANELLVHYKQFLEVREDMADDDEDTVSHREHAEKPQEVVAPISTDMDNGTKASLTESDALRRDILKMSDTWQPPSLFAVEFCPTREQIQELEAYDEMIDGVKVPEQQLVVEHEEQDEPLPTSHGISQPTKEDASPSPLVQQQQNASAIHDLLKHIEEIDIRDEAVQQKVKRDFAHLIREDRSSNAPEEAQRKRAQHGLVVLDAFIERMDKVISPTSQETHLRKAILSATDISAPPPAVDDADKSAGDAANSVDSIKRKAQLQMMLAKQEAQEHRRMREEDARVEAMHRAQEEHLENILNALSECIKSADAAYRKILQDELASYQDLSQAEQRHMSLSKQAEGLRHMQAAAQIANDMMVEYEIVSRHIEDTQKAALRSLESDFHSERKAIESVLHQRYVDEQQRLAAERNKQLEMFMEERRKRLANRQGMSPSISGTQPQSRSGVHSAEWERLQVLHNEYESHTAWCKANEKELNALSAAINEEINCRSAVQKKRAPLPYLDPHRPTSSAAGSPTLPTASSHADSHGVVCLDSALFKKLNAVLYAAAAADPFRAGQHFHTVSCALENISAVDYDSLALAELRTESNETAQRKLFGERGVPLAPLLRELDLGSNQLQRLSLRDLIKTFPALQRLQLNDNSMSTLEEVGEGSVSSPLRPQSSMRGIAAAQENALAERSTLRELNISSNNLKDLTPLSKYLSSSLTRLIAYANKIGNLEALTTCSRLSHVEVNRNAVTDVQPLGSLKLLQVLNVCDNNVENMDILAAKNWLLQSLYISKNALSRLPDGQHRFLFLGQLFLNNNRISAFSKGACMWMPFLSVLQAEGNTLRDISGLAHCPRLQSVKLCFNDLRDLDSLSPLFLCKRISTLDVSENPFYASIAAARVAAGDAKTDAASQATNMVKSLLLQKLPCLQELNNEPVQLTPEERTSSFPDRGTRQDDATIFSLYMRLQPPPTRYNELLQAATMNVYLTDAQTERDVMILKSRRMQRSAIAMEEQLQERLKAADRSYLPAIHCLSSEIEKQSHMTQLRLVDTMVGHAAGMSRWHTSSSSCRHLTSPIYEEKRRIFVETRARQTLSRWLYGQGLIRRAKRELHQLRAEHQKSEAYLREVAVRKIQPVWRGAALRSRLKRILRKPDIAGVDDDDEFQKVEVDFDVPLDDHKGIGELLQRALQAEGATAMPTFEVPDAYTTIESMRSGSAPAHAEQLRLSDGEGVGLGHLPLSHLRPSSQPVRPGTNTSQPLHTARSQLEAEWGPAVASRIQKKKKKMNQVHQQHMRKEIMRDPLGAKKQLQMEPRMK